MVDTRRGGWMQTFTSRQFWPLDPRPEDIMLNDIAHSLACQNRFAGHTQEPYSVAEHCFRVSEYCEAKAALMTVDVPPTHHAEWVRRVALAALLHDASEAYLVDVPRPIKGSLYGYAEIESRVQTTVNLWANLPADAHRWDIVKHGDEVLLATEARDLMGPRPAPWTLHTEPLGEVVRPWHWTVAKHNYRFRFEALMRGATNGHGAHFHHCPECYTKHPCGADCMIAETENGIPFGYHHRCDDCGPDPEVTP